MDDNFDPNNNSNLDEFGWLAGRIVHWVILLSMLGHFIWATLQPNIPTEEKIKLYNTELGFIIGNALGATRVSLNRK